LFDLTELIPFRHYRFLFAGVRDAALQGSGTVIANLENWFMGSLFSDSIKVSVLDTYTPMVERFPALQQNQLAGLQIQIADIALYKSVYEQTSRYCVHILSCYF
jgi:hypothetical protein